MKIIDSVISVNRARRKQMVKKITAACGGVIAGEKIAILGLTFKPNTDDIRDSPSIDIIKELQESGASVSAYDPVGMPAASEHFDSVIWGTSAYDILEGARALVIVTEWNEFRALDLKRIKTLMKVPLIVDLRNIYRLSEMREEGLYYVSVGRPEVAQ